jgi:GNAT superfamily N-acetyltransferase
MIIKKANKSEKKQCLNLASILKEWFTPSGLKNMETDFKMNSVIVALEKSRVVGFLCYTSYSGKMLILWMAVAKSSQRKGIGSKLIKRLENISKRCGIKIIEVETLPDEDSYEPYKQTRAFYYKHRFKRTECRKSQVQGWDDQIVLQKKLFR